MDMKMIKSAIFSLAFPILLLMAGPGKQIKIQTNAVCGECEERIETALLQSKGVEAAELNLDTKVVMVTFNDEKTDAAALRSTIAKLGYDADDVKGEEKGVKKLPMCCKPKN